MKAADVRGMYWEDFAEFCETMGWSTGSPECLDETIELMIARGVVVR